MARLRRSSSILIFSLLSLHITPHEERSMFSGQCTYNIIIIIAIAITTIIIIVIVNIIDHHYLTIVIIIVTIITITLTGLSISSRDIPIAVEVFGPLMVSVPMNILLIRARAA